MHEGKHSERSAANNENGVRVSPILDRNCNNMIPKNIKEAKTTDDFKTQLRSGYGKTSTDTKN